MPGHDIIVVGASAGGVEALAQMVQGLPRDLPASVFVVLHVSPHGTSLLPQILSRQETLPAHHARNGEPIVPGQIYVAPPDCHLILQAGRVMLSRGPTENGMRPSADPLLRTAARSYGGRVIGVILSGSLDDGTAGLVAVKRRGGLTVVQDPDDALFSGMPQSALAVVDVDHCLPLSGIGPLLAELVKTPAPPEDPAMPDDMEIESDFAEFDLSVLESRNHPGTPSGFACPDCGGALWELNEHEMVRFRCRVGHAWSATSLLAEQSEALETALWTALRALEERAELTARLADRLDPQGSQRSAQRFRRQSEESKSRAALIRQVLLKPEPTAEVQQPDVAGPAAGDAGGQKGNGP